MTVQEQLFEAHLRSCIDVCHQLDYHPGYFERMLNEHGGVGAAKRLMVPNDREGQTGFQRIMGLGRPDLTVEHAMLEPNFSSLFTAQELTLARWRLDNPHWARGL